jgi:hypothetical protein
LIATNYGLRAHEVARIKKYRNKLMHGQTTGLALNSTHMEHDVRWLVQWVAELAAGADAMFGYDGMRRNTFKVAKAQANISVAAYPFTSHATFGAWLRSLSGS